jgi:TM2 domain-containing membrane protein YozV
MYSKTVALVLGIISFIPPFNGLLRFYLKRYTSGTLFTLTGGFFFIGNILDVVQIPQLVKEGNMRYAQREFLLEGTDEETTDRQAIEYKRQEESTEKLILKSAKENNGLTTPSEVALQSNASIEEARKSLDYLVSKGFAEIRVGKTGSIAYYFPGILTPGSEDSYEDI